jgi:5'-methylthioadenosine phosphorylase
MPRNDSRATIPAAEYALLGGSGTGTQGSPEGDERVTVLERERVYETPFGQTSPLTTFTMADDAGVQRSVLFTRPHEMGEWDLRARTGAARGQQSLSLFWLLREAGVKRIVAESGTASITQHFHPRDLIIPHDFIDFTTQFCGQLEPGSVVAMREPFCPDIREALWQRSRRFAADKATRVFNRAVHATVEGPRFETAAEVAALARLGGDIISQIVTPEVYLAREIGACFATVEMVLNYAEGVRPEWDYELLKAIVREGAEELGGVALDALAALPAEPTCSCASYRQVASATEPVPSAKA